jgi:hypothetical protein
MFCQVSRAGSVASVVTGSSGKQGFHIHSDPLCTLISYYISGCLDYYNPNSKRKNSQYKLKPNEHVC